MDCNGEHLPALGEGIRLCGNDAEVSKGGNIVEQYLSRSVEYSGRVFENIECVSVGNYHHIKLITTHQQTLMQLPSGDA